ncbi:MAG: ATP-binding protein [Cyanobacteria bacterium J06634_6]
MSISDRRFSYSRAALPVKISVPFILTFFVFGLLGVVFVGKHFSRQLDNDQQERAAELANLVERELKGELADLRRSARLLANDETVVQGALQSNNNLLQREILPTKSILETDVLMVFDRERNSLLDTRTLPFRDLGINTESAVGLMMTGSDISTVISSKDNKAPVLLGTAPIKDDAGIVGGIILGTVLGDELLVQINESIEAEMLVLADHQVVASTFSSGLDDFSWDEEHESAGSGLVMLKGESYLARAIALKGLGDKHFDVILLISKTPLNQAKQQLWLLILIPGAIGALLVTGLGYWLARRIARPIQEITEVAQNVVRDNDFNLQVPVTSEAEIGTLARALNQMILWVRQYTEELELSAKTLESRVDERTQELSEAMTDLKETQAQLIQSEKMSGLGQMVAGIAHEINNPISFIQGNIRPLNDYFGDLVDLIETYQAEYPNPTDTILDKQEDIEVEFLLEDSAKILDSMKMGTNRVRDIVVSLRNFSRLDESAIKDVDLCEGLDSTLLILNHRLKEGVTVTKAYDLLPLVRCSPAQINQVFTNIIANALDAMLESDAQPKALNIATRVLDEEYVQICIRDSGPGMPPEVKAKIFDPFFTTKAVGKGTGIGLGICFKIIQQHQGRIEVNSELGKGTEFVITLPKSADTKKSADTEVTEQKSCTTSST